MYFVGPSFKSAAAEPDNFLIRAIIGLSYITSSYLALFGRPMNVFAPTTRHFPLDARLGCFSCIVLATVYIAIQRRLERAEWSLPYIRYTLRLRYVGPKV